MARFIIALLLFAFVYIIIILLLKKVQSFLEKKGMLEYPVYIVIYGLHLLVFLIGAVVLFAFPDLAKAIRPESIYSYSIILFVLLPISIVKRNAIITDTQMVFTNESTGQRSGYGKYAQFRRLTADQNKELQQANEELLILEKRLDKLHNEKTIEQIKQNIEALKQRIELLNGNKTAAAEEPVTLSPAVLKINRLQTNVALQFGICAVLYIIQYGANLLIFHSSQSLIFLLAIYAFACIDSALLSITIRYLLFRWRMPKDASVKTLFIFVSYIISAAIFLGITHLLVGGLIRGL